MRQFKNVHCSGTSHFNMICGESLQNAGLLGQKCIFFMLLGFKTIKKLLNHFWIFIFCSRRAFQWYIDNDNWLRYVMQNIFTASNFSSSFKDFSLQFQDFRRINHIFCRFGALMLPELPRQNASIETTIYEHILSYMIDHSVYNRGVASSNPIIGTIKYVSFNVIFPEFLSIFHRNCFCLTFDRQVCELQITLQKSSRLN